MSGWLVTRTENRRDCDGRAWTGALAAIPPGAAVEHWSSDDERLSAACWKRPAGEFRYSGTLSLEASTGTRVAWVGACLEDSGETTLQSIAAIGQSRVAQVDPAAWNGAFAAAVLDGSSGDLDVWTDRHSHYPVYLWNDDRVAAASTELACILPFIPRPRQNGQALDLFIRCGELIDDLSHIDGITVLPGGTHLTIRASSAPRRTRYWQLMHGTAPAVGVDDAVPQLVERLTAAVRRIENAAQRLVVPLSGGLDSRLILGLCRDPREVPSATWGTAGCRDLRYAKAFARHVGSPHQAYPLSPEAYVQEWERGVACTSGGLPVRDMFVLPFVDELAERADVMLNGLAGDVMLGGNFLMRAWLKEQRADELASAVWRWRVRPDEDDWANRLIRDRSLHGEGRHLWEHSIQSQGSGPILERLVDWLLENRIFRFTNCGTQIFRTAMESHAPFFDRDVVDLLVRVPLEFRNKHRLYLRVLREACPRAAEVPWQRTALPPSWGYHANLASMAVHKGLRVIGRHLGVEPFPSQSVASPAEWFRGAWLAPTRSILLSDRTLDRGVFHPDAIRDLLEAHEGGQDMSRMLGSLLAAELFYRLHLESDPATSPHCEY